MPCKHSIKSALEVTSEAKLLYFPLFLFVRFFSILLNGLCKYELKGTRIYLDYSDIVFDPLPQYFMKQLQRVQNAASFVL